MKISGKRGNLRNICGILDFLYIILGMAAIPWPLFSTTESQKAAGISEKLLQLFKAQRALAVALSLMLILCGLVGLVYLRTRRLKSQCTALGLVVLLLLVTLLTVTLLTGALDPFLLARQGVASAISFLYIAITLKI